MSANPYINCAGNCREAVEYYARIFRTPLAEIMTYGEMPGEMGANLPEGIEDLVAHTYLDIHGTMIGFSDHFPPDVAVQGNMVGLIVTLTNEEELRREFDALAADGSVQMPLEATFWAKWYGALTDKYGIPWQFMIES